LRIPFDIALGRERVVFLFLLFLLCLRGTTAFVLIRLSLPIAVKHCGSDATCRKDQTAAIYELAAKEIVIAKTLRNPTTYTSAVQKNDIVNACIVMWRASEDFVATVQCINDATPTQ
jgi:hypothetical protein